MIKIIIPNKLMFIRSELLRALITIMAKMDFDKHPCKIKAIIKLTLNYSR